MIKHLKTSSTTLLLFKFDMKWHASVMKDILIRYKILFILLIGITAPTLNSLLYLIKLPIVNLVQLYPQRNQLIYSLLAYQLISIIWIAINESILYKQSWNKYILSLPISLWDRMAVDLYLLLFIDLILWIPIIVFFGGFLCEELHDARLLIVTIEKCIINVELVLLAQIIWLISNRWFLGLLITIDFLLVSFANSNLNAQLSIYSLLIVLSIPLFMLFYRHSTFRSSQTNELFSFYASSIKKCHELFLSMKIQLLYLIHNIEQLFLLITVVSITLLLTFMLIIYDNDAASLRLLISMSMLLNSLIVSNIFKRLEIQRNKFSSYLSALPISNAKKFIIDYSIVFPVVLTLNLLIFFQFIYFAHDKITNNLIFSMFLAAILLATTYYPQVKLNKYGTFVSLVLMVIFVYAHYILINGF